METYKQADVVWFWKTKEANGAFSNMCGGYPIVVNGERWRTTEALYQACRFPHNPDIQRVIFDQKSPMTAKMKGKPHKHLTRSDWNESSFEIMYWCNVLKLALHWDALKPLYDSTEDRPIVEYSNRGNFWAAKDQGDGTLVGHNHLGKVLMRVRRTITERPEIVDSPDIPDFMLFGKPVGSIRIHEGQPTLFGE